MKFRRCEIEFVNTQKGILEQWYAFKVFTGVKPAPYGAVDGEWKWRTAFDRDQALAKAKELHATTPAPAPAAGAAEQRANEIVQSILARQASYKLIVKAVEDQIPPELVAAMGLCGWNAFGMFETVLLELKKAELPICCPHCISGCNACGPKKWLL